MADSKITALTALTAADPANDMIPIVDVSDTPPASGNTKRISINNLLACSPSATLASATISGDLTVDTSTLKVDSSNNRVGIGTASPYSTGESLNARTTALTSTAAFQSMPLTVTDSTAYAAGVGGGINFRAKLDPSSYSNYAAIWSYRESATNSDYRGSLIFGTSDNSNGYPIERLSVTSAGNVNIANGNLVMTTSGKGIDFSAVTGGTGTATGNVLNDYEEGTWTIGLTFGGGSTLLTTSTNTGRYTKVGRQVTVSGILALTNKGTSTGIAEITGLPFTIANGNEAYSAANIRFNFVSFADVPISIGAINSTKILLQEITNAGAVTDLTEADFSNSSQCIISFTYTV